LPNPDPDSPQRSRKRHAERVARTLSNHAKPVAWRSWTQLSTALLLFAACWALSYWALNVSVWLFVVPAIITGGIMLKIFMIQHDCGHGSFFRPLWLNHSVGRLVSLVTMVPYDFWRADHAVHHATNGNLDRRGTGDIDTLTVDEYQKLSFWKRLPYRLYRNPAVLLTIGPLYFQWFKMRLPTSREQWQQHALSFMLTNLALFTVLAGLCILLGVTEVIIVHGTVTFVAACVGIWFFYVQHQFERTSWARGEDWNFHEAALWGSSYYDLPAPLPWFSGNIGIHHTHHLNSRIPNYRLPESLRSVPELARINRFSIRDSFRTLRLSLWDPADSRLISFRELSRRQQD